MKEKVEAAPNEVRETLRRDGGDVELVDVTEDGIVKVRMVGACGHCPFASFTLKMLVEKMVKDKVPEVKSVEMA